MSAMNAETPYVYACFVKRDQDNVQPLLDYLTYRKFRLQYRKAFETDEAVLANAEQQIKGCYAVMAFITAAANNTKEFRDTVNYALSIKKEVILIYLEDTPLAKGMALQLCNLFALRRSGYADAVSFQSAIASIRSLQCCRSNYTADERQSEYVSVTPQTPQAIVSLPTKGATPYIKQSDRIYAQGCFEKARMGDMQAQYDLGICYDRGKGVVQNYEKAAYWYMKAAHQGHNGACYELALLYDNGQGVEQDWGRSTMWYQKAAQRGHALSQVNLGNRYLYGQGVTQSRERAFHWYLQAAEQAQPIAQYNVGYCYENGFGTLQSDELAIDWYTKAAEQNYAPAQYNLAIKYEERGDLETSVYWYHKSAENGDEKAQNNLAVRYEQGKGVTEDKTKAFELLLKAAMQGYPLAQRNVALYYKKGWGTEQSTEKMLYWYQKASENGDKDASFALGEHYEMTAHNKETAMIWYIRAKAQGYADADGAIKQLQKQ